MKLVDANVLLYAVNQASRDHEPAHRWLTAALSGTETAGFAWACLLAFVRVSTSTRALERPLSVAQATDAVESWLAQPSAVIVEPTPRHLALLRGLLDTAGTAGNLTSDAHLAALALEHGAQIVSFDRDFARFGVPVEVPE